MKKLLVIVLLLLISCKNNDESIVDVSNIDKEIHIGMAKKELIRTLGKPKDSVLLETGLKNYYYIYETNDFTGYTLKIRFDEKNEISHYLVD